MKKMGFMFSFFALIGTAESGKSQMCPQYCTLCDTSTGSCCSQPHTACPPTCNQQNVLPTAETVYSFESQAIFFCMSGESPQALPDAPSNWFTCGTSNETFSSKATKKSEPATPETVYAIKDSTVIFSCKGEMPPVPLPNSTIYYTCPVNISAIKDR